ncbi:acyl-CoA dehydrogenase family protein [Microbacterium sp. zg.B48]|uniref:acyl-CoA dehydrogenase family protein n=1 Tax=unclassified Microbacterium TaxID=2609290 RepID=UPI00214BB90D|nr:MULTISPECIES: acyl-CoA dehydrogenase family protein [unclassified Microbacterium]MCR2763055.1 acyl-CoA dehydrogenase family protein [Microbacterium sp. zg.B48]MCR2808630.1 acyl-CoA dehydrogenase family protein [Microbacterium sp. zg.B185]WIM18936.1 acyl-CoA dehydrogenase family protein [Microbacterium sp. zg-B185]
MTAAAPTDLFGYHELLTDLELAKLQSLRDLLQEHARPHLSDWWERAESPVHLRALLAELHLEDDPGLLDQDGRLSPFYVGFRHFELARFDMSIGTLYGGQVSMFRTVVREGGSPEQVARLDPLIPSFAVTGCFALTEPLHGSDVAGGMETTATREGDTWRISGRKRWIGNAAQSDIIVVVARDAADGRTKAFLVPRDSPGLSLADITGKISLRMVRNADILLEDVRVDESQRLQRIDSFRDLSAILAKLRYAVGWNAAGLQAGAYEAALAYALRREQFGRPIAGFQLIQEKLTRMLGNATATLAMTVRLTELHRRGAMADEHAALTKTWAADRARETVALAREICGAEGIRVENDVARFFADAEALYTFEGTHEVNSLIVGKAITGLSAFTR